MNMNMGIVARALYDVGQFPLTDDDTKSKNTNYLLCREFYLSVFLEALSEVEWTGGRKREKLVPTGRPVIRNGKYRFAYDYPFDCAKPIELQNNEYFLVEDRLILTDVPNAELLYVSNGKVLRKVPVISAGRPGDIHDMEYLTAGPLGTYDGVMLWSGRPADIKMPENWDENTPIELPDDPDLEDDFPDYVALEYEPKFYEYVEKNLAARLTMKLSSQPGLHVQLLQEALLIKQEATKASKSSKAAKIREVPLWTEEMGKSAYY